MSSNPHDPTLYEPDAVSRERIRYALLGLLAVVLAGTAGFMYVERWSFLQSLYFTVISITTVGYGDEGISADGKNLALLLLVVGFAVSSYAFAVLVQHLVTNGLAWRRRMQSRIDKLNGHTIVCGYGRIGRTVCEELDGAQIPFVVVENDSRLFAEACEQGRLAVEGSACEDETLITAGIQRARHLVSAVDSEESNIVISLSARELSPQIRIVARAETESAVKKLVRAGANRVVSPFQSGGREIAAAIVSPGVADFLSRSHSSGDMALADVFVRSNSPLVGRVVGEFGRAECPHICFVSLEREEDEFLPVPGSLTFCAGDHLIVAGHPGEIVRMLEQAGQTRGRDGDRTQAA